MKRYKRIILILLGALLLLAAAFFVLQIREVKVEGSKIYSEQEVIQSVMSDQYSYHTLYFLVKSKLTGVKCLPFIQEIDVKWKSPSRITLRVYDKSISGCVKYMGQYVYFDKDGIVLQSLANTIEGVPVVTGIKFGKFTMNKAFEVEDDTLFNVIMNLSQLISHYKVQVDQIRFDEREVTLYSGKVKVFLGKKDFYDDDMAALSSVLKKTNKKGLSGTINMERFEPGDKIILKTNDAAQDETDGSDQAEGNQDETDGSDQAEGNQDETDDSDQAEGNQDGTGSSDQTGGTQGETDVSDQGESE